MAHSEDSHEQSTQTSVATHSFENAEDLEKIFNQRAIERISRIAEEMPSIIAAIERAQAGGKLIEKEQEIVGRLRDSFLRAGLDFDPGKANLNYLRDVAKAIKAATSNAGQSRVPLHVTAQALNVELSQALVGSTMAWASVSQQGATEALKRGLLAMQRYGPAIRKLAPLATTSMASLRAADIARKWAEEDETPAIISPYVDESEVMVAATSSPATEKSQQELGLSAIATAKPGLRISELSPPSADTLAALESRLADVTDFEILIGGVPLYRQSERKTLMDDIFREEFVRVAQENGCLPDPRKPGKNFDEFGGSKSQKRIGNPDKAGNLGSRQPDSTVRWKNGDKSWTEVHWNSTTPGPDGIAEIFREWQALVDMSANIAKHLSEVSNGISMMGRYRTPVLGDGPIYHMAEKKQLSPKQLREYIRKKLRDRFDKDFKDCKFIGESKIIKLDEINDPDLPAERAE